MNEFTTELVAILNHQYERHNFDGIVQVWVDLALKRSGFTLVPPSSLTPVPPTRQRQPRRASRRNRRAAEHHR